MNKKPRKVIVNLDDYSVREFNYQNSLAPRYLHLESYYISVMPALIQVFETRIQENIIFPKMAAELERLEIRTPYGKKQWGVNTVRRLFYRWQKNSTNPRWFFCDEKKT